MLVGHFIRGFLRPTESFVYNQIVSLRNTETFIYCHHILPTACEFQCINQVISIDNLLSSTGKLYQMVNYKFFRNLSNIATEKITYDITQRGIQLLHFHYLVDARFFLKIAKKINIPKIVSGYGWDVSLFPQKFLGYGKKYLNPLFSEMDLFLAMSHDMQNDLLQLGCPAEKILIHYFGVDAGRFQCNHRSYGDKEKIVILFLARLAGKKAPTDVLFALKKLENDPLVTDNWTLNIVGDGPLYPLLQKIVKEFRWESKVTFNKHISYVSEDFTKVYHSADIYILPSKTFKAEKEGIPGTLVEAMASGLPVVSTYHAGIPSVIKDGVDGFLCKEGDIDDIATKLRILLTDSKTREFLGQNAAKKVINELDISVKTRELEDIYSKLLSRVNNKS